MLVSSCKWWPSPCYLNRKRFQRSRIPSVNFLKPLYAIHLARHYKFNPYIVITRNHPCFITGVQKLDWWCNRGDTNRVSFYYYMPPAPRKLSKRLTINMLVSRKRSTQLAKQASSLRSSLLLTLLMHLSYITWYQHISIFVSQPSYICVYYILPSIHRSRCAQFVERELWRFHLRETKWEKRGISPSRFKATAPRILLLNIPEPIHAGLVH